MEFGLEEIGMMTPEMLMLSLNENSSGFPDPGALFVEMLGAINSCFHGESITPTTNRNHAKKDVGNTQRKTLPPSALQKEHPNKLKIKEVNRPPTEENLPKKNNIPTPEALSLGEFPQKRTTDLAF